MASRRRGENGEPGCWAKLEALKPSQALPYRTSLHMQAIRDSIFKPGVTSGQSVYMEQQ